VLFEVATIEPGFLTDEDIASLGQSLKLPPWEEPHRAGIEASLVPVTYRQTIFRRAGAGVPLGE
jgi:glyoxalase family protein